MNKYRGRIKVTGNEGDGDLVFGSLLVNKSSYYIIPDYAEVEWQDEDVWTVQGLIEVDPDSVGQFTERQDDDGLDVWSGNIIMFFVRSGRHSGEVVYLPEYSAFGVKYEHKHAGPEIELLMNLQSFQVIADTTDSPSPAPDKDGD